MIFNRDTPATCEHEQKIQPWSCKYQWWIVISSSQTHHSVHSIFYALGFGKAWEENNINIVTIRSTPALKASSSTGTGRLIKPSENPIHRRLLESCIPLNMTYVLYDPCSQDFNAHIQSNNSGKYNGQKWKHREQLRSSHSSSFPNN